jgi:Mrp family chromosome partitioning ATPase
MNESVNVEQTVPAPTQELRALIEKNKTELSLAHGNLLSANGGKDVKSLFITSCHPREGKTVTAASLAYSIARYASINVLLVEGNLSKPDLHRVFGVSAEKGITNAVYDGADLSECIQPSGFENVSLLTCGSAHRKRSNKSPEHKKKGGSKKKKGAKSTTLYRSPEFAKILKRLRSEFDLVIFDGPSLLESSEASWACPHFDGALLVIACEDTKWEIARHVQEKLESVGGVLLGAVLNRRKYYVPSKLYKKY